MRSLLFGTLLGALATPASAQHIPPIVDTETIGPAADYPVVIGEPFIVDGELFTPLDTLNYDRVGYISLDDSATGVTGSHKTLPLPSYVEVTALDSGRTILVRLERRGPMTVAHLLGLSPAAKTQLDIPDGAAVRMRRINPPEAERAELRAGAEAPLRMTVPEGLLDALRKRLPEPFRRGVEYESELATEAEILPASTMATIDPDVGQVRNGTGVQEPEVAVPLASEVDCTIERGAPVVSQPEKPTGLIVQLGAFTSLDNAQTLAARVGGFVTRSGSLHLVRTGPFASREKARETLAKLRAEGYSDALIQNIE